MAITSLKRAAADHIWSSIVSFAFVERVMLVDNKTPCDRLIKSYLLFFLLCLAMIFFMWHWSVYYI